MWKIIRWFAVASLVWTAGYIHNRYLDPEVNWIKTIYEEKIERSSQIKGSKRILIVGGSGTHFGIDALQIEQQVGIPVVNMGLHAGLGLNTILASVASEIRPGDIVLLIPEYGLLADDGTGYFSSMFGAAVSQPGLGGFGVEQRAKEVMLMGVPGSDRIVQSIKRLQENLFAHFSENTSSTKPDGQYQTNLDQRGSPMILPSGSSTPDSLKVEISEHSLKRLNVFHQDVEQAGGILVFGLPWILSKNDDQSVEAAQTVISALNEIAPVIYDQDLNLKSDPSLFGDTIYHLSPTGRKIRSSEIVNQLQSIIN
ncbi:hypothetical protein [Limnoraphis robusta]|uniref:hypothetical protein n=1 Tax=Limnoraphis robusta TaxID=1118279 RepID=UPI00066ABC52|nr:hypothetical protein [Limnoraphis robusta]